MNRMRFLAVAAAGFIFFHTTAAAWAQENGVPALHQVEAVTLYPGSAKLELKTAAAPIQLESGEVALVAYLPGYANPGTLSASIDGKLTGMNVERLDKDDSSDPILAPWKAALQAAENERDSLRAEQEAVMARISMWQNPGMPRASIAPELEKLDQAMQAGLKAANARLLELAPLLAEAEKKVVIAQNNFNNLPPSYKVNFVLARLRQGSDFSYSYMLGNCGWQPTYTLNALPEQGKVELGFSAELYQRSGLDWKDVKVILATNAPGWNITPPQLDLWYIGQTPPLPAPEQTPPEAYEANSKVRMQAEEVGVAPQQAEMTDYSADFSQPQETIFATYSTWDMGKRTLLHDKSALMAVSEEILDSNFFYTARPKVSAQAFLTAAIKPLPDEVEGGAKNASEAAGQEKIYPRAEAVFMVEGNTVGSAYYPPEYKEDLFFGANPLIKVSSTELTNQSDEKGFFGKVQTRNWHWKFEVENQSPASAEIRVEDSFPILADARMELKQSSSPAPEFDIAKQVYLWQVKLEPKAKLEIEHKVEAAAPAEVGLDSTR